MSVPVPSVLVRYRRVCLLAGVAALPFALAMFGAVLTRFVMWVGDIKDPPGSVAAMAGMSVGVGVIVGIMVLFECWTEAKP